MAWLGATALAAYGLLGPGHTRELPGAWADRYAIALDTVDLDAGRSAGFGCTAVKELRFEMLPANADPPPVTSRRTPVCLAVYHPTSPD
jgi:hypothetical protein